jgi:hypothetical protein
LSNPYAQAADRQFWSRAMSWPAPGHVDPVSRALRIGLDEPVATLGSCFAQHIARHLAHSGGHYLVTETAPPDMPPAEALARQFGIFSARFGNVYTVRQALQLIDRAFGRYVPKDSAWTREDGRWVDPFRPQIEPEGFDSAAAVAVAREEHLGHVRTMFQQARWLVFTLGLTEAWLSREDGAVYPLAPGVAAGSFDAQRHAFVNFGVDEVRADLDTFIARLRAVNPGCGVVLTVSPVPLIATFEDRQVWTATSYSKAVLRVAADEAERRHERVVYFPSYEVITSPAAQGRYWADDLRQVTEAGVRHVMRLFTQHVLGSGTSPAATPTVASQAIGDVVCDEETIEHSLRAAAGR